MVLMSVTAMFKVTDAGLHALAASGCGSKVTSLHLGGTWAFPCCCSVVLFSLVP